MCRFLQNKIIQHPPTPPKKKKKEKAIVGSLLVVDGTLTGGKLKLNFHG